MGKKKVKLKVLSSYVTLDNGVVKLKIMKPDGLLTNIKFGGVDNLLDLSSSEMNRGYRQYGLWDRYTDING